MNNPYKPVGYSSVSPHLMSSDAKGLTEFINKVFGFKQLRRFDNENGTIMHIELQIDDTVIMIADGGEAAFPVWLHVYVPNVDESYQRALAAGGVVVAEPSEADGIDRRAGIKDPLGNTWWISTSLS